MTDNNLPVITDDRDPYYYRTEVSNSDLSALAKEFKPDAWSYDVEKAYRFGTLLDCRITEPHKVDVFKRKIGSWVYTPEEMELSLEMKKAFYRDPFCSQLAAACTFQKITVVPRFRIQLDRIAFYLPFRCKWDLFIELVDIGGDIKTTTATTLKQFEEAVYYFDYDRQRAVYMDLEKRSNDFLIGISKVNQQVFKIPIKRGDRLFKSGEKKYKELAFQYWTMFGNLENINEL